MMFVDNINYFNSIHNLNFPIFRFRIRKIMNENLKQISIHKVGNKGKGDLLFLTDSSIKLKNDIKQLLSNYFISAFQSAEYYHLYHDTDLNLNEVYTYISAIFDDPKSFHQQSINLAKHLYNESLHPQIKSGEFYVVYFEDCFLNGELVDAVGLFKSENKETFLEIEQTDVSFEIESKIGININKVDKGCLIYNTNKTNGYVLSIVDTTNKSIEAKYWRDDFLKVFIINNDYHQTNQFLGIAKQFVSKQLENDFEVSKADKIDLLNRSMDYFKKNEQFNKIEFEEEVFHHSNIIESFRNFETNFKEEFDIELDDKFMIHPQAVKKQNRIFKSVIKLDKNFHIYIHGDRNLIEQGVDDEGRKFYKIYYDNES